VICNFTLSGPRGGGGPCPWFSPARARSAPARGAGGLGIGWSARRWRPCGRPALPRSRARAPARRLSTRDGVG